MRPVAVEVAVSRPADEVFAILSDVEQNPRWQRGMVSCRWTSPSPHGAGATYDQTARFLRREIVSGFRVTDHEPGRRVRFASVSGPFPIVETRTVEPLGPGSCRVRALVEGDASGVFRVAAPLLRALVARSVRSDYRRLRDLLERGG